MMPSRVIAHLDMNSYFASVEQQANPQLRGRPLGVCAYLHEHGCVIAASIEAKRRGMHVGMTVHEARKTCPDAVFVENDPPKYRAVTSRVFTLLHELTDCVEHYSIDEAFLDLTGWYRDPAEAAWALIRVRRQIAEEIGEWLRCSIGIAPSRFLAKTASDLEKPNGLVVITPSNLDEILTRLDLQDVCGIGPRMRRRIERLGLRTLVDIKRYPLGNFVRVFGQYGFLLWHKLHGHEYERVVPTSNDTPKSIGHSYCVPQRVNQEGNILGVLVKLTERVGRRLRSHGYLAGCLSVSVGFRVDGSLAPNGPFWRPIVHEGGTLSMRFDEPLEDAFSLVHHATRLLGELWKGESVNFLAVTVSDFSLPSKQRKFFEFSTRLQRASSAMDTIRDRYGDESIAFGSMFKLSDEAPDRIGFRKTEGIEVS